MTLRPSGSGLMLSSTGPFVTSECPCPASPLHPGLPQGLRSRSTHLPHTSPLSGPGGSGRCSLGHQAGSHRWRLAHRPLGDRGASKKDTEVAWERAGS